MLDPSLDVRGNVETAVAPIRALLARFDEINTRMGEGPDSTRWTGCSTNRPRSRTASRLPDAWDLDRRIEIAMDAMRLPPGDADVSTALGRRTQARRSLQDPARAARPACCSTSLPTTSTPKASPGSNGPLQEYAGTVVLVTHDRYFLDNVAKWILELDRGKGIPWEGQLLVVARTKASAAGPRGEDRKARAANNSPASWNGCACRRGPASPRTRPASSVRAARRPRIRQRDEGSYCRFRRAAPGGRSSSRRKTSPRRMAITSCSRTSTSDCRPAASSA